MEKLNEVKSEICELLKGTELDPMELKVGCILEHPVTKTRFKVDSNEHTDDDQIKSLVNIIGSPIREAEVLMALGEASINERYAICEDGCFMSCDEVWIGCGEEWELGKTIDQQSDETIEFLFNVLN